MEVHMRSISWDTTKTELTRHLAEILHKAPYTSFSALPLNFQVHLFRDKRNVHPHSGSGSLTLPTEASGMQFLADFGPMGFSRLALRGRTIIVSPSKSNLRDDIVENIRRLPYQDPELNDQQLPSDTILVSTVQFGWECRDGLFSIEWQASPASCGIFFDDDRREIRVKMFDPPRDTLIIALRFSQIQSSSASLLSSQIPLLSFSLTRPPIFESESPNAPVSPTNTRNTFYDTNPRHRLTSLGPDHEPFAPYTSLAMRLICSEKKNLAKYKNLCRDAGMQSPKDYYAPSGDRGLFLPRIQDQLRSWLLELPWTISFQIDSLIRSWLVDFTEMLALRDRITAHVHARGDVFTSGLLRRFAVNVKALASAEDYEDVPGSVEQCFTQAEQEFEAQAHPPLPQASDSFSCFHVSVTPTTMFLEGPYPERSNRVIRAYPEHHDRFLRVSFMDEARLQYRFDREVDGRAFIKTRVGRILREGLEIAGRQFHFLAYSQSALKEHAVWFVSPFRDSRHGYVDAGAIIKGIGSFAVTYDPKLVYCPARYGARISQAFTATDPSISVEIDEVFHEDDIERNKSCFTDGVGTISPEMARAIWSELGATRRRRRHKPYPRALQVRFQGSKGMLSVNHKLSGRAICLRPSMIKFDAPASRQIEIARAFDKPGKYYLNRPLIMILEGLGVDFEAFQRFQDRAVSEARDSTESLFRAVKMLESHGLGTSFRVTSVMLSLDNLGVVSLTDRFYHQMMECAVHHVLRELKQHARIPIPGAWTLVGVADVHKYLEEGQIFACVKDPNSHETIYLEGPTLISRSPTIHPGDVQIVRAIGRPPAGSCFENEPLANTVVFSVKGDRSLPSCLGGGDLDGDVYNLIPLDMFPDFIPGRIYEPSAYTPAPKKLLDRPSTMQDVAEFFMEYINSDILGMVAINWLIIADQSEKGIADPDCIILAQLHSDAVDYQKSGQPVHTNKVPKLKSRKRPDWNAPETVAGNSDKYYESQRAIGNLFRAIDLPIVRTPRIDVRSVYNMEPEVDTLLSDLSIDENDPLYLALENRVFGFLPDESMPTSQISQMFSRYSNELLNICATHTLSYSKNAMLSEEEAIIGTIVAKSSQPRRRKDLMSKLREQTDLLVRGIREELAGEEESSHEEALGRAWICWKFSAAYHKRFGAKSFGWIALGAIFEAIKAIEDAERDFY